jgi:hypothetical protein
MKALLALKTAINHSSITGFIALIILAPLVFPAAAQASGESAVIFKINTDLQNQNSITYSQIATSDPLVVKLKEYLEDKQSPLADYADQIVTFTNWKRALAISLVESNMCRFTPKYASKGQTMESYNCSGIGGDSLRRYDSYMGWLTDMDSLLSQDNYSSRPIEKFIGYYVQPGSRAWLYGAKKTEAELTELQRQANDERVAQITNQQVALANPSPSAQ